MRHKRGSSIDNRKPKENLILNASNIIIPPKNIATNVYRSISNMRQKSGVKRGSELNRSTQELR